MYVVAKLGYRITWLKRTLHKAKNNFFKLCIAAKNFKIKLLKFVAKLP